ncbi:MAG: hypothetical protein U1E66_08655 [Rhodospirillales bacterium]
MKIMRWLSPTAAVLLAGMTMPAIAVDNDGLMPLGTTTVQPIGAVPGGTLVLPMSSLPKPAGEVRTHLQFVIPDTPLAAPFDCHAGSCETPASLACVYLLPPYTSRTSGCDPNIVTTPASGGSKAIGFVDAFHNKSVLADLKAFSTIFGLPAPSLKIIKCTDNSTGHGTCSANNPAPPACQDSNQCGWAIEASLDVQAAHAMAPNAKLILVEAYSDSYGDMLLAETAAGTAVAAAGGGEVSNSWGGPEFSGQQAWNSYFVNPKVVFLASTGDHKNNSNPPWSADVNFPSTSPNVIGVGGTKVVRNSSYAFSSETPWDNSNGGGGGGLSTIEPTPAFQTIVGTTKLHGHRGAPDISADADPATGMIVRLSTTCCGVPTGYYILGGTSLTSPLMAGMINAAGHFLTSTATSSGTEQALLYGEIGNATVLNDVKTGTCHNGGNPTNGTSTNAKAGWDVCTGVGTPHGLGGL